MSIGARYMALGGAGVAISDDLYAAYYNPAGLVQVKGLEVSASRQLNARLHAVNFLGAAWSLPMPESFGVDVTIAGVYYPRIHAKASGAFSSADFESKFLRFLLPAIPADFDGQIDSKTKTYRLAIGISGAGGSPLSLGFYLDKIDCKSTFCGVHAKSNGYTVSTVGAVATGIGLGARYRLDPDWTIAAAVSDLDTKLDVEVIVSDNTGTTVNNYTVRFPRKIAVGVAYRLSNGVLAVDYEITKGKYGASTLDMQVARLGFEKVVRAWSYRVGAFIPFIFSSSAINGNRLNLSVMPVIGLGWREGGIQVDLVLYAHPVMSISQGRPAPASDLTLTWRY